MDDAARAEADGAEAGADPTETDPDKYRTILENEHVRVLEYHDTPGGHTMPHRHPDSVMYTLSAFQRRLHFADGTREVAMEPGQVFWLPAQIHAGENIGASDTRVVFVELKKTGSSPIQERAAAPGS
ncbi:MAG: cytoplasmic protein [Protaetiibacter sp.]